MHTADEYIQCVKEAPCTTQQLNLTLQATNVRENAFIMQTSPVEVQ